MVARIDTPVETVPKLKKKIGFMDKLRLRKSPQYLKILGTIDGEKNLEDISRETGIDIQSIVESINKLIAEGYITIESE